MLHVRERGLFATCCNVSAFGMLENRVDIGRFASVDRHIRP